MQGEKNIVVLHLEFKQLKTYKEKLEFFDQHFGCFSNTYPEFDPNLKFIFEQKELDTISDQFEKERRKAIILERRFEIDGQLYLFNVTPVNSNTLILNDYVLYRFINDDKKFASEIVKLNDKTINNDQILHSLLNAMHKVETIESKLSRGEERGLRYRFMNVFINGFRDKEKGLLKKFYNRKKIIELYMYAQGVLFRQYLQQLNDLFDFSGLVEGEILPGQNSIGPLLREFVRKKYPVVEKWNDPRMSAVVTALIQIEANR